jgi:ubiquinone/menaquinone biosynthesis C-methylase UbiE
MTHYLDHVSDFDNPDLASLFDEVSFWSARFGAMLLDRVEVRPNLRILDAACGSGFPLFELAAMFGPSCRLVGIDSWAPAVERARWKLSRSDLPNVELVEGDAAAMPFDDGEFDLITCNLGVNNFADAEAVFRECFRVAKGGASLALTSNVTGNMREFYDVFRSVLRDLGRARHVEALDAQENHRRSAESISQMLESLGFTTARVVRDEFALRYLDGTALFNHHLVRYGFLDGWRSVLPPEDHRDVFLEIERRLNEVAAGQGELRMTIPRLYLEARKPGDLTGWTSAKSPSLGHLGLTDRNADR